MVANPRSQDLIDRASLGSSSTAAHCGPVSIEDSVQIPTSVDLGLEFSAGNLPALPRDPLSNIEEQVGHSATLDSLHEPTVGLTSTSTALPSGLMDDAAFEEAMAAATEMQWPTTGSTLSQTHQAVAEPIALPSIALPSPGAHEPSSSTSTEYPADSSSEGRNRQHVRQAAREFEARIEAVRSVPIPHTAAGRLHELRMAAKRAAEIDYDRSPRETRKGSPTLGVSADDARRSKKGKSAYVSRRSSVLYKDLLEKAVEETLNDVEQYRASVQADRAKVAKMLELVNQIEGMLPPVRQRAQPASTNPGLQATARAVGPPSELSLNFGAFPPAQNQGNSIREMNARPLNALPASTASIPTALNDTVPSVLAQLLPPADVQTAAPPGLTPEAIGDANLEELMRVTASEAYQSLPRSSAMGRPSTSSQM